MRDGRDHPFFMAKRTSDEDENVNAVRADFIESIGYPAFAEFMRHGAVGPPNLWEEGEELRKSNRRTNEAMRDLFRVYQDCAEGPLGSNWYWFVKI